MYCEIKTEPCQDIPAFVREYRGDRGQKNQYCIYLYDDHYEKEVAVVTHWDIIQYCICLLNNPFYAHGFTTQDISAQDLITICGTSPFMGTPKQTQSRYWECVNEAFCEIKNAVVNEFLHSQEYAARVSGQSDFYQYQYQKKRSTPQEDVGTVLLQLTRQECAISREMIQAGYRKISQKYHPDSGGRTADMQVANSARSKLIHSLNYQPL